MDSDPTPVDEFEDPADVGSNQTLDPPVMHNHPLYGAKQPLSQLDREYKDNPRFLHKLQSAQRRYSHYRPIRGDGNCFYRSVFYALLEWCLAPPSTVSDEEHSKQVLAFYERFVSSIDVLEQQGVYQRVVMEDFFEPTLEIVEFATQPVRNKIVTSAEDRAKLLKELDTKLDSGLDMWYMTWLRCLTSAELRHNADKYSPYLTDHPSIDEFCRAEVDAVNREVDSLQCLALATALDIGITIEYVDGTSGDSQNYVIPGGHPSIISVLYRPGHYDVIYPVES